MKAFDLLQVEETLAGFQSDPGSSDSLAVQKALFLARVLLERAVELQTPAERRQQAELDRMLQNPADKVTLVQLTDQAFRSKASTRTAEHLTHILDVQGVPRFFSPIDRALLKGFQTFGAWLPGVAVPLVKEHMQHETANVVLPAERELLTQHLAARHRDRVRMNLNFLGEALLGEEEATRRLDQYLEALQLPQVEVLSVKISTIYSQISPLAREHTLRVLCDRLELLYRSAARLRFRRADGSEAPKFIYLDMEEYRDLHLTAAAFMRTLERPGLREASAGIALQAYVPDSARVQREINAWARARVAGGGAPITIRIVKGANLEMERVEASLRDWPQAPFKTKRETDANYKRMLHEAMRPENLDAVRIGVASHNLFDLAYGLVLAADARASDRVQFEMLEGMANHQRRALLEQTRNLLLYAPACRKEEFLNAIGYLIRRLDENTGPENFLRHAFKLRVGSPEWEQLERGFREAFRIEVSDAPRRTQNRLTERLDKPRAEMDWRGPAHGVPPSGGSGVEPNKNASINFRPPFTNEADTDWSLPENSEWAQRIVARTESSTTEIPLIIDGEEIALGKSEIRNPKSEIGHCLDPSRPGVVLARYRIATPVDVDRAASCAKADPDGWRSLSVNERNEVLGRVAQEIRCGRAELMWAALANGGKILSESDVEVSEAIDFVEFYRATARYFYENVAAEVTRRTWIKPPKSASSRRRLRGSARGVVVVVPPWNFPIAIPCGGVAAALAAGNTVILKPASDTVLVAWELCQCFWRAGVSKHVLQFAPCPGGGAGARLVAHPDVDAVVLTGGTSTALRMLKAKPTMRLFAETGGKNATIVTALSDRELAIKHIIHSAFSHSGQKCSATSLLLLEAEVYDDAEFKRMLCDSVKSLPVGSAWELPTRIDPLIRPPSGDLENGLKTLEPGESWAVLPRQVGENPNLWSPGIKYGVQPGSYTHHTEFFGPVLGVMRFERLEQAIAWVNQTGYGLTSGLHSLDEREHAQWKSGVRAGNLYLNRGTTGAVVLRQPFGGLGKSSFGPGMKAGGPNYVAQLMRFEEAERGELTNAPVANEHLESLRRACWTAANPKAESRKPKEARRPNPEPAAALAHSVGASDFGLRISELERGCLLRLLSAIASYDFWWLQEFSREHDHFRLLGQDNFRRYLPFHEVRVRVATTDSLFDVFARACAARVTGARVIVSTPPGAVPESVRLLDELTDAWAAAIEFVEESHERLAELIRSTPPHTNERIRYAAPDRVPDMVRAASIETGVDLADEPVIAEGRIELLWYVREQSVCHDYHRYGNLGARAGEPRREPL
jgi:RHH-type proline utilization regulon transcriptional repressor/proline dehydrogenase/delta 1-pyrroline-5-carboxylate dehydrogenase